MAEETHESKGLLAWYDEHRRDLPWRRTRDPYRIWVSEIMLQQTRVDTALPFFERFTRRFPDVDSLAAADIDEVLAHWSGLGYYRRARQLHAAARQIVASGGKLPRTVPELLGLPGIGPYTAAAVASIAFEVPVPVLDGNVERVLGRWLALEESPRRGLGKKELLTAAAAFLDPRRPGDTNQALMELGATVCLPRAPVCTACPISGTCLGFQGGEPERYPRLPTRKKQERQRWLAAVAVRDDRILFFRRPNDSSLLAGFWEIPWVRSEEPETIERRLSETYGGVWRIESRHGKVRHSITHRSLEVEVASAAVEPGEDLAEGLEASWFRRDQLEELALSSVVAKILRRTDVADNLSS